MTALDIARLQVGIREWPTSSNRVVYNTWYYGREVYGADYPWCMVFVQWCHTMAGTPLPFRTASCAALLGWYRANAPECVSAKPAPGAIVIYNGHTGIVEAVNSDGTFTAIEGNTSVTSMANGGEVQRVRRNLAKALAFIVPKKEDDNVGEVRYQRVAELPEYYRKDAQRLIDRGALKGSGAGLDVSDRAPL